MEKQSYYLIILLVALVICFGVFWFQFNNNVATFILINQTEVAENGSFSGVLMDAYSYGVANKTITYHKPGHEMGTLVDVVTDENGEFTIEHAEYLPDAKNENYYGDFTFAGDGKYQGCTYEGNVTVVSR
ncbi:hypothetical protein TL18_03640 [Methanobrevibacter sp. YE315]|uniref:hypothetical protein n=1 Tax=Methanobrevibacter sp. YE315 TaxID=1609968 RepID=UPI000764DB44|nr:hypothetical protein [Methanobrevibacter sp. YE315]AMD17193.1 hypothetical protein TL18_03640 [Methanobrevibacter sp. YE315]